MKKICIILSVILMLFVVGCAPPGLPPEPTPPGESDSLVGQAFRVDMVIAGDYSPPWDLLSGDMKFTTTPEGFSDIRASDSISLDVNVQRSGYIYYQGYYYNSFSSGWVPYDLDGTRYVVDGAATNWIETSASSTLDFTVPFDVLSSGENYVLVYICEWDAGWHCGPRTLGDTDPHWTIQSFVVCQAGEVVDGAGCSAVSGLITEVCDNGADDDHNGDVDCDDAACVGDVACVPPVTETICDDGLDDDGDGDVDCADSDCAGDAACVASGAPADAVCTSDSDCASGECVNIDPVTAEGVCTAPVVAVAEICDNTIDDDGDGLVDCADSDCVGDPACPAPVVAEICDSRVDEDGDGLVDCADPDCVGDPACPAPSCTDSDGNNAESGGQVEVIDAAGAWTLFVDECNAAGTEVTEWGCTGDVEGSSVVVCAGLDPVFSCQTNSAGQGFCAAGPIELDCTDGIDNDGDSDVDCADSDCSADPACVAPVTETICDDGLDDDGDGDVDCADSDCAGDAACVVWTCFDSDGGSTDYLFGGEAAEDDGSGIVLFSDTCLAITKLKEYGCVADRATPTTVKCDVEFGAGWTCETDAFGGYCNAPGASCTDTDSGVDAFGGGQVTVSALGVASIIDDTCASATMLKELYCRSSGVDSTMIDCAAFGGTCETDPATGLAYCSTCTELDGGDVPSVPSITRVGSTGAVGSDQCMSSNTLKEAYCGPGDVIDSTTYDCTIGSGSCETDPASGAGFCELAVDYCTDTDSGIDPTTGGSVKYRDSTGASGPVEAELFDSCLSATQLVELSCIGSTRATTIVTCSGIDPAFECRVMPSGKALCALPTVGMSILSFPDACVDTDGGFLPGTAGGVKLWAGGFHLEAVDTCKDDVTVMEYECRSTAVNYVDVPCGPGLHCREDSLGQAYCR